MGTSGFERLRPAGADRSDQFEFGDLAAAPTCGLAAAISAAAGASWQRCRTNYTANLIGHHSKIFLALAQGATALGYD